MLLMCYYTMLLSSFHVDYVLFLNIMLMIKLNHYACEPYIIV